MYVHMVYASSLLEFLDNILIFIYPLEADVIPFI